MQPGPGDELVKRIYEVNTDAKVHAPGDQSHDATMTANAATAKSH